MALFLLCQWGDSSDCKSKHNEILQQSSGKILSECFSCNSSSLRPEEGPSDRTDRTDEQAAKQLMIASADRADTYVDRIFEQTMKGLRSVS